MTYLIAIAIVTAVALLAPKLAGWVYLAVALAVFIVASLHRLGVDRMRKGADNEGMTSALTPIAALLVTVALLAAFMTGRASVPEDCSATLGHPCTVQLPEGAAEDTFGLDYQPATRPRLVVTYDAGAGR